MNNLNFLRLVSGPRIFSINIDKYSRLLDPLAKRFVTASSSTTEKSKDQKLFQNALPDIIDNLTTGPKISLLPELANWVEKILEHNVNSGKHIRGLMTMYAYKKIEKPENITEENLQFSRVLGWCIEMTEALICVVDDMMDSSTTRRGRACWYRMPNVGFGAINDTLLLTGCISETLEEHFINKPYYTDLVRILNDTKLYTSMGQHIDITTSNNKNDYNNTFTMEHYNTIVLYKTSYITFRQPILLGLTLVKDIDKKMYAEVDNICVKLGQLYQMQNDYLDCFGNVELTGKEEGDIQDGKCTWLAVTALKLCNEDQKELFSKNYGRTKPENVAAIKNLYKNLGVLELYKQKEIEMYDDIVGRAGTLPSKTAPTFFYDLLKRIYKRDR